MSRIFILVASRMEADPLAELAGVTRWNQRSEAGPVTAGPNQLEFFITGIGPKQAAERATEVLLHRPAADTGRDQQSEKPDAVVVTGLCGGLTESLPEKSIVIYSSCISAMNDGAPIHCSPELCVRSTSVLEAQNVPCRSVTGITSRQIAITKDDKLGLARTGAQAVDMESYAILSAAGRAGVPAIVVRVVSDSLDHKLPDLNPALNEDGTINKGKAVRIMVGSPILTARAIAANKRAARQLARALIVVLSADFPCLR